MQTLSAAILALPNGEALLRNAVPNARRRARTIRRSSTPHTLYTLVGGPFNGHLVSLSSDTTAVLTVGGQTGQYLREIPDGGAYPTQAKAQALIDKGVGKGRLQYDFAALYLFWPARG